MENGPKIAKSKGGKSAEMMINIAFFEANKLNLFIAFNGNRSKTTRLMAEEKKRASKRPSFPNFIYYISPNQVFAKAF